MARQPEKLQMMRIARTPKRKSVERRFRERK
jgi:hypothetical protein